MRKLKKYSQILKAELPATLSLALPVVIAQMGQMLMGLVDTFMVGKLGAPAIGAVSLGSSVFYSVAIFSIGLLLGLDYLISFAFGKKDYQDCHHWFIQGLYFGAFASLPVTALIYVMSLYLGDFGITPEVVVLAKPFLQVLNFNLLPFILFGVFRQYLQAMNHPRVITVIMILANLANFLFNWLFIFGHWNFPAMGPTGSALATTLTRVLMLLALIAYTFNRDKKENLGLRRASWKINFISQKRLIALGLPAAFQLFFEVAIFSLCTLFAGRLGANPLAAHTIVLNIASFTFMVPLGISSAAAVRVGQELGEGDPQGARFAGWTSLFIATAFMSFSALTLLFSGTSIIGIFIADQAVIDLARKILVLAALFQVADGIQTTGTGALRGLGDTRSAMLANMIGYWLLTLPVGYYLCFVRGYNIPGLWAGLTLGLMVVAALILGIWIKRSSKLPQTFR